MRPTAAAVERFRTPALAVLDPSVDVVAVHVRTGDLSMHGREKLTFGNDTWRNKYWECAGWREGDLRNASRDLRPVKYLFVTDSLDYKEAAQAHFGDKLLTTDTVPIHIAKMQVSWHAGGGAEHGARRRYHFWVVRAGMSRTSRPPSTPTPLSPAVDVGRRALWEPWAAGSRRYVRGQALAPMSLQHGAAFR